MKDNSNLKSQEIENRALLLIAGIFNFPIGIALYFYLKDKDNKNNNVRFARMGAYMGICFFACILLIIFAIYIYNLFNYCL